MALTAQREELFQVTLTHISLTLCEYIQGQRELKTIKLSMVILLWVAAFEMLPETTVWVLWDKANEQCKSDHPIYFWYS